MGRMVSQSLQEVQQQEEMITKRRDRSARRRLWVLGGLLVTVLIIGAIIRVGSSRETGVREGDAEASYTAETVLPEISDAIEDVDAPDRAKAAESWLRESGGLGGSSRTEWVVGSRGGARIPVTFYVWWEDRSFSGSYWPNGPYWGRSCQVVTVTATRVTTESRECPSGTPEHPPGG